MEQFEQRFRPSFACVPIMQRISSGPISLQLPGVVGQPAIGTMQFARAQIKPSQAARHQISTGALACR